MQRGPAITRVKSMTLTPVSGMGWNDRIEVTDGRRYSEREMMLWLNGVTPGYFATYGTTLLAGRDFAATDREGAPRVAIVNQAFAEKFIGGERSAAVGRVLRIGEPRLNLPLSTYQIVGVVESAAYQGPREGTPPTVYLSLPQSEGREWPSEVLTVRANAGRPSASRQPHTAR